MLPRAVSSPDARVSHLNLTISLIQRFSGVIRRTHLKPKRFQPIRCRSKKSLLNPNSSPLITWKSKSKGCVCWRLSLPASLRHKLAFCGCCWAGCWISAQASAPLVLRSASFPRYAKRCKQRSLIRYFETDTPPPCDMSLKRVTILACRRRLLKQPTLS